MTPKRACVCTYVASLDSAVSDSELRNFAAYLSALSLAGCEEVVVDPEGGPRGEERQRVLRWVSRYVTGERDLIQAAIELTSSEKIIVASQDSRYTAADVAALCDLLDGDDVVEPEEFVDPLPWWGGIDAGSMLLQRGLDSGRDGRTFAFRRSAWHRLFALKGASVRTAGDVFVRREPSTLAAWLRRRFTPAATPAAVTTGAAFLACVLPLVMAIAALGGYELAGGYAGLMAAASVLVAARGRAGAGRFFPPRACLFAPLSMLERSLAVYWALFARLRAAEPHEPGTEPETAARGRMRV